MQLPTISRLTLGTVELGMDYGFQGSRHFARPGTSEAARILHRAVELGINFIDTAPAYGEAEAIIGRVLPELHPRPFIATKFMAHSRQGIVDSVENSLRALGVDCIDLLQIHNATTELLARGEVHEAFVQLQQEGKIRSAGASIYGEPAALLALGHSHLNALQVPYNFLDQRMARSVLPQAAGRGKAILVRSAFLRGVLTDRINEIPTQLAPLRERALAACEAGALAETALRFCLSHKAVSTVLIGVRSVEELEANVLAAAKGPLDADTMARLLDLAIDDEALVSPTHWAGLI